MNMQHSILIAPHLLRRLTRRGTVLSVAGLASPLLGIHRWPESTSNRFVAAEASSASYVFVW